MKTVITILPCRRAAACLEMIPLGFSVRCRQGEHFNLKGKWSILRAGIELPPSSTVMVAPMPAAAALLADGGHAMGNKTLPEYPWRSSPSKKLELPVAPLLVASAARLASRCHAHYPSYSWV